MTPLTAVASTSAVTLCPFCAQELAPGAHKCPLCLRVVTQEAQDTSDVYELPAFEGEIPPQWQALPVYELDVPVRCPHCRESIRTVRIIGLMRTQVSFTSTLPRKGRVMACPACERVLSAELSGLI